MSTSRTTLRIPDGLLNLLTGLAREVLRAEPTNVVEFAALHFQKLLEQRERSSADPAEWGAQLEEPPFQEDKDKEDKDKEEEKAGEQAGSVVSMHTKSSP